MKKVICLAILLVMSRVSFAMGEEITIVNHTTHDISTKMVKHLCVSHPSRFKLNIPAGETRIAKTKLKKYCLDYPWYKISLRLSEAQDAPIGNMSVWFDDYYNPILEVKNYFNKALPNARFEITCNAKENRKILLVISEFVKTEGK